MVVRKILEQTLSAGSSSVVFTDAEIPNSLIRVYSSNADIIPISRTLSGTSLTVTYEPQTSNIDVAVEIVKSGLDIVDNVTSTDADKALSAKQGKALKDAIDTLSNTVDNLDIPDSITDLDDVNISSIQDGQVLSWDEDSNKFINTTPAVGSYREEVLIQNTSFDSASGIANVSKSFTLSESLDNFDAVVVYGYMYNIKAGGTNVQSNIMSMIIFKNDFYDTAYTSGSPSTNPFLLNASSNTARRAMAFQFTDSTHISTVGLRTEEYVEPILFKVVGIKF